MTDPRMTPTNDAPVTVEQCDREAAARAVECVTDSPPKARPGFADLWEDDLAEAFAKHRLAALASAPAGDAFGAIVLIDGKRPDWVRDDDRLLMRRKATGQWAERSWYGFNWNDFDAIRALADHPHYAAALARPHSAVAPAGDGYGKWHPMLLDLVNAIHGDRGEKTQAIGIDLSYQQALAAALARPRVAVGEREAYEALVRARDLAMRMTVEARIPECGSFGAIAQDLDAILALQSPPAKAEG